MSIKRIAKRSAGGALIVGFFALSGFQYDGSYQFRSALILTGIIGGCMGLILLIMWCFGVTEPSKPEE